MIGGQVCGSARLDVRDFILVVVACPGVLQCWSAALIWQDYITDPESEGQEERGGRLTSALCRIMQNHINDRTALGDNPIAEARSCLLG